jgi:hypothetical protein
MNWIQKSTLGASTLRDSLAGYASTLCWKSTLCSSILGYFSNSILPPVLNIRESLFFKFIGFQMYFVYYRLDTLKTQ